MTGGAPRLSVAAPCYDEEEGIAAVVREWDGVLDGLPFASEIVLCNDGSTDGTAAVLDALQHEVPRLRVVAFETNGGYGRALSAAIDATRGDLVATIDSDGQFDLADVERMIDELEDGDYDVVTGYRVAKEDSVARVLADRALRLIVRGLFGLRVTDSNCALKLVRGEVLRGLRIEARGYPTPTEILVRLNAQGRRIGEAPVAHRERTAGESKLRVVRTGWSALRFLLYLRRRLKLYEKRIIVEP